MSQDKRKNNGKSLKEMLKISQNGTVSVTHGGHGFLSRGWAKANDNCEFFPECGCEKRCKAIDALAQEMESEIMSLPHIEKCDLYLVRQFTKLLIFQIVVDRWLQKNDIVTEKNGKIQMQGIFNQYFILANSLQRLGDRLGLSPLGRKQLQSTGKMSELAKAIVDLGKNQ